MSCYKPLEAWYSKEVNPSGKRSLVFSPHKALQPDDPLELPCGRCVGCRLEHSRQWAVRCMHEASEHEHNSFVTLTYNNESLPDDHSVHKEHLQKFFKRLRKLLPEDHRFKYFACGEYGDSKGRPHYHILIFGYDFPDKYLHTKTKRGDLLYRSSLLEKAWPFGHSLIGSATFESAAYVARYVMKKRKGDDDAIDKHGKTNKEHYMLVDPDTGEIHQLEPEFCLMSRGSGKKDDPDKWRFGIGRSWLTKFKKDTDKDFITIRGKKMKLPKYYDNVLAVDDELEMMERKEARKEKAIENWRDNTPERLVVREKVKLAQIGSLTRDLETL